MIKKLCSIAAATVLAVSISPAMAGGAEKSGGSWSGNIGVHSKYVLRGMTNSPESDRTALQGGFDYDSGKGFYAGYWGSSLSYSYDSSKSSTEQPTRGGFENDFYAGYKKKFGKFELDVGLIQYYYLDVDNSDLTELKFGLGFGDFSFKMQYLLTDGYWGNEGDIYYTFNYSRKLPKKFKLGLSLGYYTYDDDDAGNADKSWTSTDESGAFRHFNITLSRPIGNTGAEMYVQYIIGGKGREQNETQDQEDTMVFGITYSFDM